MWISKFLWVFNYSYTYIRLMNKRLYIRIVTHTFQMYYCYIYRIWALILKQKLLTLGILCFNIYIIKIWHDAQNFYVIIFLKPIQPILQKIYITSKLIKYNSLESASVLLKKLQCSHNTRKGSSSIYICHQNYSRISQFCNSHINNFLIIEIHLSWRACTFNYQSFIISWQFFQRVFNGFYTII